MNNSLPQELSLRYRICGLRVRNEGRGNVILQSNYRKSKCTGRFFDDFTLALTAVFPG